MIYEVVATYVREVLPDIQQISYFIVSVTVAAILLAAFVHMFKNSSK